MSRMTQILKTMGLPLAMLLGLACGGGCGAEQAPLEGRAAEDFLGEDEVSPVIRITERQIAAGARTEATLRAYHFDHAGLNSLGREKLDLMLADEDGGSDGELVVYLDLAGDEANSRHADARRADVEEYLASRGLSDGQVRLESGPNPHNTMSAATAAPQEDEGEAQADGEAAAQGFGIPSGMSPTK